MKHSPKLIWLGCLIAACCLLFFHLASPGSKDTNSTDDLYNTFHLELPKDAICLVDRNERDNFHGDGYHLQIFQLSATGQERLRQQEFFKLWNKLPVEDALQNKFMESAFYKDVASWLTFDWKHGYFIFLSRNYPYSISLQREDPAFVFSIYSTAFASTTEISETDGQITKIVVLDQATKDRIDSIVNEGKNDEDKIPITISKEDVEAYIPPLNDTIENEDANENARFVPALIAGIPLSQILSSGLYATLLGLVIRDSFEGIEYEFAPAGAVESEIRQKEHKYYLATLDERRDTAYIGDAVDWETALTVIRKSISVEFNEDHFMSPKHMGNIFAIDKNAALGVAQASTLYPPQYDRPHGGGGFYPHYHPVDREGKRDCHVWFFKE